MDSMPDPHAPRRNALKPSPHKLARRSSLSLMNFRGSGSGSSGGGGGSSSFQHEDIPSIPCVGKIKASSSLPSSIAKFVCSTLVRHPRYLSGTFLLAAKTHVFGLVQTMAGAGMGAAAGEESEGTSIFNSGAMRERSQRLQLLHEVDLNVLLVSAI